MNSKSNPKFSEILRAAAEGMKKYMRENGGPMSTYERIAMLESIAELYELYEFQALQKT